MKNKLKNITKAKSVMRHAVDSENDLNRICKKIWEFTNPLNEKFIFGKFVDVDNRSDFIVVTLGTYVNVCGTYVHLYNPTTE